MYKIKQFKNFGHKHVFCYITQRYGFVNVKIQKTMVNPADIGL